MPMKSDKEIEDSFRDGTVVMVAWWDSASTSEWLWPGQETFKPLRCLSVGVIIARDNDSITLAQSRTGEGQIAGTMTIPHKAVAHVRNLGFKDG